MVSYIDDNVKYNSPNYSVATVGAGTSYIDDNVKNNSSKYFGRWLLSVGHGGRWWLATRTTM